MPDNAVVVQKAYVWIHPKIEKFPKSYRFSIGQNLNSTSLELLMNLVDAMYQSRNAAPLAAAVRNVNRAQYSPLATRSTFHLLTMKSGEGCVPGWRWHYGRASTPHSLSCLGPFCAPMIHCSIMNER